MDYLPPEMLWNMWEPDDDAVEKHRRAARRDKFEPYIGRNPGVTNFSNPDEQAVIKWVKGVIKRNSDKEVAYVVDDKLSWVFYNDKDDVIVRIDMPTIQRITKVMRRKTPILLPEPDDIVVHEELDSGMEHK